MCKLLIVYCFSLVVLTKSAVITINDGEKTLDIKGPELNGENIKNIKVNILNVTSYEDGEEQFDTITNFANVNKISIGYVDQLIMPKFTDLKFLRRLNIYATEITYIKKECFTDTTVQELYLKNNKISTIERASFGNSLITLSLACNELTRFQPNWFQNPRALRVLNLRGNKIASIQQNAFKGFSILDDINLGYNYITTIGPGAFAHVNTYTWLFLHNNNLKTLSENVFANAPIKITNLYLNSNNLTFLSKNFLAKVTVTDRAPIEGNPWQCSCYDDIIKWVPWKNYGTFHFPKEQEGEARCVAALSFSAVCVEDVDHEIIQTFWENSELKIQTHQEFCECSRTTDECS